jgi:CRP-like cAMP-binding protein
MLSKNLKEEIILHLNGQLLKNTFIINKYEELCILLTSYMKEETVNPNETIFRKGEDASRIFYLTTGTVLICDDDTKIIYNELKVYIIIF